MHYLDRLLEERVSATGVITNLHERAAADNRDLTEMERSEITRLQERCVQLDGLLTEHEAQSSSARAFAELQSRIEANRERTDAGVDPPDGTRPPGARAAPASWSSSRRRSRTTPAAARCPPSRCPTSSTSSSAR